MLAEGLILISENEKSNEKMGVVGIPESRLSHRTVRASDRNERYTVNLLLWSSRIPPGESKKGAGKNGFRMTADVRISF